MLATFGIDVPTKAKLAHALRQVAPIWPDLNEDCWADFPCQFALNIADNYVGLCGVLKGLTSILREQKVDVKFREEDITPLRSMAEGLREHLDAFTRQLERRTT